MNTLQLSIVIPCLNEKGTILQVVKDTKENARKYFRGKFEIIISDNGSTDGTLAILNKVVGVKIVHVPVKGYGAALHWGILNSRGKFVIFADADCSYPFSNLKYFSEIINLEYDLVLGSRIKGKITRGSMPVLHRYFGTPILTTLIRILYKIPTSDCNSGMRMVKKSFYKTLNMKCSGMEWASELLLKTALCGGTYSEIPILFMKDKRNRNPHLNTWSDGWRHLKSIILLKPETLYFGLLFLAVMTIVFLKISFAFVFLFANLFVVLSLSLLTLYLLGSIIDKRESKFSRFLLKFRLVPITMLISLVVGIFVLFVPESHLGIKLFLVSVLGIIFMWIFFVETIKTHLVNRLPEL